MLLCTEKAKEQQMMKHCKGTTDIQLSLLLGKTFSLVTNVIQTNLLPAYKSTSAELKANLAVVASHKADDVEEV